MDKEMIVLNPKQKPMVIIQVITNEHMFGHIATLGDKPVQYMFSSEYGDLIGIEVKPILRKNAAKKT